MNSENSSTPASPRSNSLVWNLDQAVQTDRRTVWRSSPDHHDWGSELQANRSAHVGACEWVDAMSALLIFVWMYIRFFARVFVSISACDCAKESAQLLLVSQLFCCNISAVRVQYRLTNYQATRGAYAVSHACPKITHLRMQFLYVKIHK